MPKYLMKIIMVVLTGIFPLTATAGGKEGRKLVNHVVVVWMADEYKTDEGINNLIAGHEMLREIPGLISLSLGRSIPSDRAVVDDSFDLASHFQFESVEVMQKYLSHPVHVKFLEQYTKGKVKKAVIYDF